MWGTDGVLRRARKGEGERGGYCLGGEYLNESFKELAKFSSSSL